jgi:hypothetical protein
MHVPHFLQMSARGIFGRGRDTRRDSTGTAGSLRIVGSSVLRERVSLESIGMSRDRDLLVKSRYDNYNYQIV